MSDPTTGGDKAISSYYGVSLKEVENLRRAVEIALSEGYRRGIEDAAKVARDHFSGEPGREVAAAIRALAEDPIPFRVDAGEEGGNGA